MSYGLSSEIAPSPRPATRDKPRVVTRDAIDAFEKNNPALQGIGRVMVSMGLWVLVNEEIPEGCV